MPGLMIPTDPLPVIRPWQTALVVRSANIATRIRLTRQDFLITNNTKPVFVRTEP